ncbi:MAG: hydrogenase formation protein HypD, partial [Clostridium sp.]
MNREILNSSFEDFVLAKKLLKEINKKVTNPLSIMEVCGTHTRSIFKYGIDKLLPKELKLIAGPGCPVCVTPNIYIDNAIELSKKDN